jgi:hypothetical protein
MEEKNRIETPQDMASCEEVEGRNRRKVAIDLMKANIFAVVIMCVVGIVLVALFFLIWHDRRPISGLLGNMSTNIVLFLGLIVGIAVHELIHGITWACFAQRGWKSISFGIIWKYLTPYCHCDEPMRIRPYQLACLMPGFVLGVIPSVFALFIGNLPLLLWGIFFIAAAAGDIWMAWLLTKENPNSLVLDHPSEAGFYIYDE